MVIWGDRGAKSAGSSRTPDNYFSIWIFLQDETASISSETTDLLFNDLKIPDFESPIPEQDDIANMAAPRSDLDLAVWEADDRPDHPLPTMTEPPSPGQSKRVYITKTTTLNVLQVNYRHRKPREPRKPRQGKRRDRRRGRSYTKAPPEALPVRSTATAIEDDVFALAAEENPDFLPSPS